MIENVSRDRKLPWTMPRLIIVTRGKAEESVLKACKRASHGGPAHESTCLTCSAAASS